MWARAERTDLQSLIAEHPTHFPLSVVGAPATTTDDWPYVYHRNKTIPTTYLAVTVILLALSYLSVRQVFDPSRSTTWRFFLLGAGFLLLETQLIGRLALYFGSTWLVNCIAITLLLSVLVLANFFVERGGGEKTGRYYVALVLSLLLAYFVRFAESVVVAGAPTTESGKCVGCSAIRDCRSVRSARAHKSGELDSMKTVAGGLIQNVSFIVGLKAMLLAAAGVYVLAALVGPLSRAKKVWQRS